MDCCFDRTGFPYVELKDPALAVSLLPLTKLQFERYLADLTPHGDHWYEELLKLNTRVSPQHFTPEQRERLFLTGLLPAEAEAYAAWLGEGYRLPTVAEWRGIYRCFQSTTFTPFKASPTADVDDRAAILLRRLEAQTRPRTPLDFSLMHGGVVEWARDGNVWTGLGAPRPSFQTNLWNPLRDTVPPIQPNQRLAFFGARLVRDLAKIP
ncbi:MAG: SUMF1/EgtB/PvdO family nonheme iron enzyme [Methylococcales bacterium]